MSIFQKSVTHSIRTVRKTTLYKYALTFLAVLLFLVQSSAEDQDIAKLFRKENIVGTMVISSLYGGQTFIYNDLRANHRFTAASTFKILNTLIALEEKAVKKDDIFKWNGDIYTIADWNRDQTLQSAFKGSCVWCFQELARRVGTEKYRNYLQKSTYGELCEPMSVENFWLDGSLKISAIEQVEFLKKVYCHTLPFGISSYETLQKIMLVEQTPSYRIRAKTGMAGDTKPKIGWYVGYVETSADVWFFATNIDINDVKDLPLRLKLTLEALEVKSVIR